MRRIIEAATARAGWQEAETFRRDCERILESLVAELTPEKILAAVDRQGFAAHEYAKAARLLHEIAVGRRPQRVDYRDCGGVGR